MNALSSRKNFSLMPFGVAQGMEVQNPKTSPCSLLIKTKVGLLPFILFYTSSTFVPSLGPLYFKFNLILRLPLHSQSRFRPSLTSFIALTSLSTTLEITSPYGWGPIFSSSFHSSSSSSSSTSSFSSFTQIISSCHSSFSWRSNTCFASLESLRYSLDESLCYWDKISQKHPIIVPTLSS